MRFKTPCTVSEPYDNPFLEKSNPSGKKEKEKMKLMEATTLCLQRLRAAHALPLDKNVCSQRTVISFFIIIESFKYIIFNDVSV